MVNRREFLKLCLAGLGGLCLPELVLAQSDLQSGLNSFVKGLRQRGLIRPNERTAWSIYDFRGQQKLVSINETIPMQSASMAKLFVALAYFYLHRQNPKKYPYYIEARSLMEKMLIKSDNKATNTLMARCGGPKNVTLLCQKATGYRFKQLRLVEYIPSNGRTYLNRASALDYHQFWTLLWQYQLPFSEELKRITSVKNHDRITTSRMKNVRVYDKTGSTAQLCGNAGIVAIEGGYAYTFIGIIERQQRSGNYTQWISTRSAAMREVSDYVYQFMLQHYALLSNLSTPIAPASSNAPNSTQQKRIDREAARAMRER